MSYNDIVIPDLLPPSEDGVFKTLMCHPDAEPILRDVIESFLQFPVTIVKVRNVETHINDINEKRERFDVNCAIDDGSQADVEMQAEAMKGDSQRTGHKILKNRAIFYLCDLHSGQSGRGLRYDSLRRSFQVTFCGYTVFPERKDFINRFSFRDKDGNALSDSVGIIFVELSKLSDIIKKPIGAMTREEQWSTFIAYGGDTRYKELVTGLTDARKEIKMASELLQTISRDENERARFRSRRMFQMDQQHDRLVSIDEGREEGIKIGEKRGIVKGEKEARIDVVKKAYEVDLSIEQIIQITGMSKPEVESIISSTN